MGDPAGCGPQITGLAWHELHHDGAHTFAAIGPKAVFNPYCPTQMITDMSQASDVFPDALPVLDIGPEMSLIDSGKPSGEAAAAIIASIALATQLARDGKAGAVVTNPINKALLYSAGFKHPGHTEFLASLCKTPGTVPPRPVMMLVGGGLRVALATIHMPLIEAAQTLNTSLLSDIAVITDKALKRDFALTSPRITFTGLNPHAGENGTIGREEIDIINPAARALRARGIDISDARSADTVFAESLNGDFDAVIAMTHDQGLIPIKTLDFWGGVNVTLGLPIIRTSPDHGTAYEAAANGACRPDSLIAAIRLAVTNAANRAQSPTTGHT
jgi:4-hydroxythreonine-4-phosphate dehydrogenase